MTCTRSGVRGSRGRARRARACQFVDCSMVPLGLALACTAIGRLDEAEREALRGERLRRAPQPTVGHAHALLVLAHVRVARSRLERASDLERAHRRIAEFRSGAATRDRGSRRAGPRHRPSERQKPRPRRGTQRGRARRTAVPCDRSLPARDRRAALHLTEHGTTHTRELYRKQGAPSRADAVARADPLGLLGQTQSPG
jgi:hypothetical protein